ncbi:MAG: hypothetical protein JNM47_03070 [Hyphomonadaceae bacterium]|nr:hypothetical protein [Hyphomonadaceae bacterium]
MMKSIAAAALAAILAGPAFADATRLSNADFQRANRCLAYAGIDALADDPLDLSVLQARFDAARTQVFPDARTEAEMEAREIRAAGRMATTPARVERLKARRDQACAVFTDGLTVAER